MEKVKKLFGGINLTWPKIIIMAIIAGVYTGVMALLPCTRDTSFEDITISFEVWILFGIFIIMNSKSAKDSALKCFVFFLISQPLIYLVQVPFAAMGWQLFIYYKYWFIWTLFTIPMGFIGWYMKKDKWWGLLILTPMLLFLGAHYYGFIAKTLFNYPGHLLSTIFCFITLFLYPICIFNNKKVKIAGIIISVLIIISMTVLGIMNRYIYTTIIATSGESLGITFNDSYNVYLEDSKYGNVKIEYEAGIEDYVVKSEFKRAGKTKLIFEDGNGLKTVYEIEIMSDRYNINKVD